MMTSVPSTGDAVEAKERSEWGRRMGQWDRGFLRPQSVISTGERHLDKGNCSVQMSSTAFHALTSS